MPLPGFHTFRGRAATIADRSPARRLIVVFVSCLAVQSGVAQTAPVLPCDAKPFPSFAKLGDEPNIRFWLPTDVPREWTLPPCTGWPADKFSSMVTVAGRFRFTGTVEDLLARAGAISDLEHVQYWSKGNQKWQRLIVDAAALKDRDTDHRRADFSPDELREGEAVHVMQEDNLAGKAVLQMRVVDITTERLVFGLENVKTLKYVLLTVFPPGEMRSVYFFEHESGDVWRLYSMLITGPRASRFAVSSAASAINRAVAFYRHYAGIPTDKAPPAAPKK